MATKATQRKAISIVLAAFIVVGLAYSVINPLHEATDELRHYRFVRHIVERRSLPVQGDVGCSAQGHHPPLFYMLGAIATAWVETGRDVCYEPPLNPFWNYRYWEVGVDNKNQYLHGLGESFPWHGEALAAHIIRAVNVLIGAGVVWLTWAIARAIWPKRPSLALGATAFVAFNPMFAFMAGAINNDIMAAFSGAAIVLACVRLLRDEGGLSLRWGVVLGGLYGMALMSKFNLAATALLVEAAVLWVAWRRKQWRRWFQVNALMAVMTLLIAGWWFARNQILYGEPTGFARVTELWGVRDPADSFWLAVSELPYAWTSLWGRFGYGQVPLPQGVYSGLRWLGLAAGLGLLLPLLRRQKEELSTGGTPLLLQLANAGLFLGVLFNYMLVSPAGPMGRFFFPALPSLAILIFYGLSRWLALFFPPETRDSDNFRLQSPTFVLALVANAGMATLSLVALFGYLAPAYARPPAFDAETAVPNPVNVQFDALAKLRGYQLSTTAVRPGGFVDIDLYWEVTGRPPGDYLLFVHLIDDEAGTIVAQRDTHPGLGNFPSSQWRPGDRFVESIRLYLPQTAYAPAAATLSVGLYAPNGYRLGIIDAEGMELGDAFELGTLDIVPQVVDSPYPNPQNHNFEDEIRLVGYEYNRRVFHPGDRLVVTLYWEALRTIKTDYIVEVHLRDEPGNAWNTRATADSRPQDGQTPTTTWTPGQVIRDSHTLILDSALPPNSYVIHVALIDSMTKGPQNIVAEDGRRIDNHLLLARINVRP